MQKQLYLLYLLTCCSYSSITLTDQPKIMLISHSSNDKNKCYITAKDHNIIVGTLTASLKDDRCIYQIDIASEYQNTGVAYSLIKAMAIELQAKNPTIDLAKLKITKK